MFLKCRSLTTYHVLRGKQAAIWGYISRAGAFPGRWTLENRARERRPNLLSASFPSLNRATTVFDTSAFLTAMRLFYPRLSAPGPIYPTRHVRLQTVFLRCCPARPFRHGHADAVGKVTASFINPSPLFPLGIYKIGYHWWSVNMHEMVP